MSKRIFIGNLPFSATESTVNTLFSEYGTVDFCRIIIDRSTGQSKGFAFVEMREDEQADKAIQELNGQEVEGRTLRVDEARPLTSQTGLDTIAHRRPGFRGGRSPFDQQQPIRGY